MMNNLLQFSRNRDKASWLQIILLGLGLLSIALLLYVVANGLANNIEWTVISELKDTLAPVLPEKIAGENFTTSEPIFYVQERYMPSGTLLTTWPAWMWITALILGISLILAATLQLRSIWFMLGIVLLGGSLIGLRLEILTGQTNQVAFILPFFLIGGLAYYFNSWSKTQRPLYTLPILLAAWGILLAIVLYFYKSQLPLQGMAAYGISVGLVISALMLYFVSHEIIVGILWLTTAAKSKQRRGVVAFSIATVFYLLNVLLMYLEQSNRLTNTSLVLSPSLLAVISLALGWWGFRRYTHQTNIFSFQSVGSWLYLGGFFITISTLIYIHATANDPLIELANDFIAIAHLVVGAVFFVHLLINFWQPLQQGLAVHKVAYKPLFSRLLIARVAAAFGIIVLFAFKGDYSISQWIAGQQNAIADYHLQKNDLFAAEAFYKESLKFDDRNHKANYALASLALSQGNRTQAAYYFKQANQKKGSPYAIVGLSETLRQENLFFDAIFTLQAGLKQFPNQPQLATNLGRLYAQANSTDSSYLYLNQAYQNCHRCEVEAANLAAFWLENARTEKLDSIYTALPNKNHEGLIANKTAIRKKQQLPADLKNLPTEASLLNGSRFAALMNTVTNDKNEGIWSDSTLRQIQHNPDNAGFFDDLLFARSKQQWLRGNKHEAIQQAAYVAADTLKDTRWIAQKLGVWLLHEGVIDKATTYFQQVADTATVKFINGYYTATERDATNQTVAAELLKQPLTLANYRNILNRSPYNPVVLEAVAKLLNDKKQPQKAYDLIYEAVQVQTKHPDLWRLYARQAMHIGLPAYAADGLAALQPLVPAADYEAFAAELAAMRANEPPF